MARRMARLTPEGERVLARAVDRYLLSGRAFDRVLKVGRTVADLVGSERVGDAHLLEALRFRGDAIASEGVGVA
jgi:magnesium chelatase family protein